MKITILYHVFYFQRELFLLDIDGSYTMVYRGSGLNGGKKGMVLPFNWLKDSAVRFSEAREGIVPGYIFKEFFYRGFYKSHKKRLEEFPRQIKEFTQSLEKILGEYDTSKSENYDSDEEFSNILPIAKKINNEIKEKAKGLKIFDWYSLVYQE